MDFVDISRMLEKLMETPRLEGETWEQWEEKHRRRFTNIFMTMFLVIFVPAILIPLFMILSKC